MAIENAKTLNVRIRNKYDSYENWVGSNLVLEAGEIAIAYTTVDVKVDNGTAKHPALLMKVGDGEKTFANLPWLSARAADVLSVCKNEGELKTFVNGVIADAGIATNDALSALSGKVTTAEGKITTLEGKMTAVEGKAATNEAAIAALDLLVGDESVNAQIKKYVDALNLAGTYEAKGEAAKVQTALNEYKTSNDAAVQKNATDIAGEITRAKAAEEANANAIKAIKDGTTIDSFKDVEEALAGKEASGAAAQALVDAKAYADGLAGNYDAKGAAATAEANAKAYADGLAKDYDAAGSAADALEEAKGYTDSEMTRLVGDKTVGTQITDAITGLDLPNTYAAKSHKHTKADITDFAHTHEISEVNGLQDALDGKQAAGDYATKAEAKGYADAKDEAIAAAKKAGDDAQADVDALAELVGTLPADAGVETVVAYVEKKTANIASDATVGAIDGRVAAIEADYLKAADKTALQDQIDVLDGLVGDETVAKQITDVTDPLAARVKAVEDDYLKAADKTELEGKIQTNANAIERLTNGVSAEEVDGVNDLIQYVKDHGTEVTGIKADIKANSDAIDAIEADYLKAADKTELNGLITGLDTRMGAAETAIGTKAAQTDLEALAGRVTTIETEHNTESTGLKARIAAAEADIDALETKVGDKTVSEQIATAIADAKADASNKDAVVLAEVTAAVEQHNTDKAALEAAIAKKANDADLASIAKTGSTDDLVQGELVLVFDCGGAGV